MGTSVLRQLKPQISNNADHKLGDARAVKETNELVLQSKRNELYVSIHPLTNGVLWWDHLAIGYGQRNYLLTSIRDSKNTHTEITGKHFTQCVSGLSPSLVTILSQLNDQPFGMTFIPSTVGVSL